jgi:hypothetical protein
MQKEAGIACLLRGRGRGLRDHFLGFFLFRLGLLLFLLGGFLLGRAGGRLRDFCLGRGGGHGLCVQGDGSRGGQDQGGKGLVHLGLSQKEQR